VVVVLLLVQVLKDNFFEQDGNGDVMPTNQNDAIGIFYEYDDNNDLQPVA